MPTKAEMLAFFKKFRAEDTDGVNSTTEEDKRQANESAQLLASALTRVERPGAAGVEVHPPAVPRSTSFRQRLSGTGPQKDNRPSDAPLPQCMPNLGLAGPKVTLILDVDETLVHSSFKTTPQRCDLELGIVVNGNPGKVFVKIRPYLKEFFDFISSRFEVVIFTASLSVYCNPLMDILDSEKRLGNLRLFREHCTRTASGAYIKDLSLLGRSMERVAIIDNSPVAYYFQPRNAIPIVSWFEDPNDQALLELLPMLGQLSQCKSVYDVLDSFNENLLKQKSAQ